MNLVVRRILPLSSVVAMCAVLSACSAGSLPQTFETSPNDGFEPGAEAVVESPGPTTCVQMGEGARCFVETDGGTRRRTQRAGSVPRQPAGT